MKEYDILHKRVKTKHGEGTVEQVFGDRLFIKLDKPIVKNVGRSEKKLGVYVQRSEVE